MCPQQTNDCSKFLPFKVQNKLGRKKESSSPQQSKANFLLFCELGIIDSMTMHLLQEKVSILPYRVIWTLDTKER